MELYIKRQEALDKVADGLTMGLLSEWGQGFEAGIKYALKNIRELDTYAEGEDSNEN